MSNLRCSICNCVSSESIETELGDFREVNFVPDPISSLHVVCQECKQAHEELMLEYEKDDDVWGWKYQSTPDNVIIVDFTPEEEREDDS